MPDSLPIGKTISIRECGYDEIWLQDQIVENPSCLKLGDLEVVSREKRQSSGGRLDILMKDPEDDSMYEVEVMLGETDETHIIRTIEYWAREKRRWPQRQHYPVLVAETITRRFFEVIQIMSNAIPMVAIQASIEEAGGQRILTFHKILDVYEEPDDSEPADYEKHDEAYWVEKAAWTNEISKVLLGIVSPVLKTAELNHVKNYISIAVNGNNYLWFHKRASDKSLLSFWVGERLIDATKSLLDAEGVPYSVKKNQSFRVTIDKKTLEKKAELFRKIADIVQKAWAGEGA